LKVNPNFVLYALLYHFPSNQRYPMVCLHVSLKQKEDNGQAVCKSMFLPSPYVQYQNYPQLLLSPPLAALSSSIFATRFLNSSYWHFS